MIGKYSGASLGALGLILALSGCGGGDSGGTGSTPAPTPSPTPTPTAGANASLIGTLATEAFRNTATAATFSVPRNGNYATTGAGAATLSIIYNATSGTYTLNDGTRSVAFGTANIDRTQTTASSTTYAVTSGSTTDTVILVNNGTTSPLTRYVGAGIWLHEVDGATTLDARSTGFAYGVQTPNSAVPRAGTAMYDVRLLGVVFASQDINVLGGSGKLDIDFAHGTLVTTGSYDQQSTLTGIVVSNQPWNAVARLSASSNSFTGQIALTNLFNATWQGNLYGPSAEEIGATWSSYSSTYGTAASGVFWGSRNSTPINTSIAFGSLTSDTFFAPMNASFTATPSPTPSDQPARGTLSNITAGPEIYAIFVGTGGLPPQYLRSDGSFTYGPDNSLYSNYALGYDYVRPEQLSYTRAGTIWDRMNTPTSVNAYAYGFETAASAVPRTGNALFNIGLLGAVAQPGGTLHTINGTGQLAVDLAAGTLSTSGNYTLSLPTTNAGLCCSVPDNNGGWTGSGTLSSSANALTGTVQFDGALTYSAGLTGKFFGPAAQEVGGVINATPSDGARLVAAFAGTPTTTVTPRAPALTPLASLTGLNMLTGATAFAVTSPSAFLNTDANINVIYNADTGSYHMVSVTTGINLGALPLDISFSSADRLAGQSDSTYSLYHTASGDVRVLNSGAANPLVALTYSSFAAVNGTGTYLGMSQDINWYVPFGEATPLSQIPRSGTANYTGVVVGQGTTSYGAATADLSGTSTLGIDFGTNTANLALNLSAVDRATGVTRTIGNISMSGTMNSSCGQTCTTLPGFSAIGAGANYTANAQGMLFGPNAAEFGAAFTVHTVNPSPSEVNYFAGVTMGKKTP
ncbi:hypothetical protein GTZ99_06755 [Novosphingobium sp. FSY-8]|uniref:Transferrin-binding protein B C-lobe/N-lobe beta barrel domain-containing protein n=1 Tax=Novosphingobium ovatum TaxID=1908523 RepID=A0ABW9XCJ7_9SPHN|nr:transferrin-binding protein-like solute binding protein [Novosphingobium ovatum]NBC36256.1 hypothetical protein [Novosphingobium ovatum]